MTPPDAPTQPASVAAIHRHLAGLLYSVIGDPNFLSDDMAAQPHYWTIRRKAETIAAEGDTAARAAGYAAGVEEERKRVAAFVSSELCKHCRESKPLITPPPGWNFFYTHHDPSVGGCEQVGCEADWVWRAIRALAPRPDGAEKLRFHSGEQVMEHFVPGYKRPEPPESPYKADGAEKEETE